MRRTRRHSLEAILVITLCAVICGTDDWVSIAHFGHAKRKWFRRFLAWPHGIPSHAWATAQGVCLGQVKTDATSNEITAIPQLLDVLALAGRIVTTDAMGCQTAIAQAIQATGGDDVLSLKGNQTLVHDDIRTFFVDAEAHAFAGIPHTTAETVDGDHGRIEVRCAWATDDLAWLDDRPRWSDLRRVLRVDAERTVGERTSCETRFFLSSLPPDAALLARTVRSHWAIENSLH